MVNVEMYDEYTVRQESFWATHRPFPLYDGLFWGSVHMSWIVSIGSCSRNRCPSLLTAPYRMDMTSALERKVVTRITQPSCR